MKVILWVINWLLVVVTFFYELTLSTLNTIHIVLFRDPDSLRSAILAVPLEVKSAAGITLFANMISLTPGTTSLEVSGDQKMLYVHCLDTSDPAATVRHIKATLERRAMGVFS